MENSIVDILGKNTMQLKLGLWASNIRENLQEINNSKDITDIPKIKGASLCIANGESLNLHLDEINKFKGIIFSCERNIIKLLEKDIVPNYMVCIDGDPIMEKFIDNHIIDKYSDKIIGIFTTTVSPNILKRWKGEKVFFNAWLDNVTEVKSVSLVFQQLTRKSICHTGGNCGTTLWFLAHFLESNPIVLLGLDLAYPINIPDLSYTSIWDAIKHLPREEILNYFRRETNPFRNTIITDYVWEGFKDSWNTWIKEMNNITTIQCSDYTIVHKEPLKIMTFKEYLNTQ